jgi:hypothetical protein
MPSDGHRKKRLIDLVLAALEEASASRSELTVTLLKMVLLNEIDEEKSDVLKQSKRLRNSPN